MAKDKEKRLAKELYLQGKRYKEISQLVGVTEKTLSRWVATGNWKTIRDAKLNTGKTKTDNIKQILSDIADETLDLNNTIDSIIKTGTDITIGKGDKKVVVTKRDQLKELRKQRNQLADEAAKWNKALESLDAENKVSFATYIAVFDEIFKALRDFDQKLYMKTLNFQEEHLQTKANQYK